MSHTIGKCKTIQLGKAVQDVNQNILKANEKRDAPVKAYKLIYPILMMLFYISELFDEYLSCSQNHLDHNPFRIKKLD